MCISEINNALSFFNNAAIGGAIGSFTAFIFGLIAYDYTKKREKWVEHHNSLVKTERLLNRHFNQITGNTFLLKGAIETFKKGAFSENILFLLDKHDYMINIININVINEYLDYEAILDKLNHDIVAWNRSNDRLFNVALTGKVSSEDIERNMQELSSRSEYLVVHFEDLLEQAYSLNAYIRRFMEVDQIDMFARLTPTAEIKLTKKEISLVRKKVVKESQKMLEKDKERIEKLKT